MLYSWSTIGHSHQIDQLERDIREDSLSQAYLFQGPNAVGKFHLASIFASILLCPKNLCRDCDTCYRIKNGIHPDQILLEDNGQSIKIDEMRSLIGKINLTTQEGRRIVLIENMERMPIEAQNAFLKTLEEPSKDSIFLLTSSKPSQILSTIHSRVRTYDFSTIKSKDLEEGLKKRNPDLDQKKLQQAITFAQGRSGLAIGLIEDESLLKGYTKMHEKIDTFLKENHLATKFQFVEEIEKSPSELAIFLDVFSSCLRKMLYVSLKNSNQRLNHRFSLPQVYDLFESLTKTGYLMERNVNKKLSLENLMIRTEKIIV